MVPPKLPPATTGPKYGSMKSGWLFPERLTASRPMEPARQMMACMSLRAPPKSPVATVEIFWRVGLVSRSFRVGWFVFKMSKLQARSEEHTSELQSHSDLVCRLLLEKKKHRK